MKDIIILGAGGEALEIVQVIKLVNSHKQEWNILGYLDDNIEIQDKTFFELKVLGTIDDAKKYPNAYFISSIGHPDRPKLRSEIRNRIPFDDSKFATVIHPSTVICPTVKIGYGCFIQANCTISTNSIIGNNVLISYGTVVGHESSIGDGCVIGVNVTITSDDIFGQNVYVGPGAVFRNELTIGNNVLIGIGAIVTESIPDNTKHMTHFRPFSFPQEDKNPYTYE